MNRELFCIRLTSLKFFSKIGVYAQERKVGNEFEVSVHIWIDASSFISEDLSTSISYAEIYEEIADVMKEEWLLLESVCKRLSDRFLERWPSIKRGKITIDKLSPPIKNIQGKCGVEYEF